MFAVVRTGGKQYRVQEGRTVRVDRLPGEPGEAIELADVLLMGDGSDVTVGTPSIVGARVVGTIAEQGRAKKIVVFRYKSKTRSRKKTGHRQHYTAIRIEDILAPGQSPKPKVEAAPELAVEEAPKRGRGRRKAQEPAAAAEVEAVAPEVEAEASAPEAATAPPATEAAAEPEEAPAEKPKRARKKAE